MNDRDRTGIELAALAGELAILMVIAKHLKRVDENTTYSDVAKWSLVGLVDIATIANNTSNLLVKRARRVFANGSDDIDAWSAPLFAANARAFQSVQDIYAASTALETGLGSTVHTIETMFSTSVMGLVNPKGRVVPIAQAYRESLQEAVSAMQAGELNYVQSIKRMTARMAHRGVRVFYPSGVTRELYSAVSGNVYDNYRMTMQKAREEVGVAFGANGVEISAHGLCAADHLPYQGKQYSYAEFKRINESLPRHIAHGYNCHHTTTPIILELSRPAQSRSQLKELREQSQRIVHTSNGDMTAYEFTQYQRRMETAIRKKYVEKAVLQAAGADTAGLDSDIRDATRFYRAESRAAGIKSHMERVTVYKPSK